MITKKLKELVKDEAEKLRQTAKKTELRRLVLKTLQPNNQWKCIYGLMTGHCDSSRALRLLNMCAEPFSTNNNALRTIQAKQPKFKNSTRNSYLAYYSPIEFYISQKGAKNENLIAYLKGEIDVLKL